MTHGHHNGREIYLACATRDKIGDALSVMQPRRRVKKLVPHTGDSEDGHPEGLGQTVEGSMAEDGRKVADILLNRWLGWGWEQMCTRECKQGVCFFQKKNFMSALCCVVNCDQDGHVRMTWKTEGRPPGRGLGLLLPRAVVQQGGQDRRLAVVLAE